MYKKILVPLDGSEFSECSLEHVKAIAIGCKVPEVVLLRVVEPVSSATYAAYAEVHGDWVTQIEKQDQAEAESYLSKLADNLRKEGIAAQTTIVSGRPSEEILDYASNNQVDLIIMSTHGKAGLSRWVFGSVTGKILHDSAVPVMVVPSPSGRSSRSSE